MKKDLTVTGAFVLLALSVALLFFQASLLGLILFWFGVNLTIWQNLAIVFLANMIFGGSK